MKAEKRVDLARSLLLYAVTDRHWLGDRTLYDVVRQSLEGGVTFLQLREKDLDEGTFFDEAVKLQAMAKDYGVPFVINDNVDIAIKMNADGVHVGQHDMEAGDVRALIGPDKILGVSAQTVDQAVLAEKRGADYLGVGAVFPTGSKDDADDVSFGRFKGGIRKVDESFGLSGAFNAYDKFHYVSSGRVFLWYFKYSRPQEKNQETKSKYEKKVAEGKSAGKKDGGAGVLDYYKGLLDRGVISEEEYQAKVREENNKH